MKGSTLAKGVIALVWLVLLSVVLAIGLELFLKARWDKRRQVKETGHARYDMFKKAYHPFALQYINPNYLFFFPFDTEDRVSLSNEFVSIDSAGFRGPGPEFAGDRPLAFLIGGSTAFSFSSSDSTSITGYLNRLQYEYFFVNASVPSWNSTQELFRLAYQILEYNPALVVSFDGANEMAILLQYHREGLRFPPGTPESFHRLQSLVEDIRAVSPKPQGKPWFDRFFPRLSRSIRARMSPSPPPVGPPPAADIREAADKYLFNLGLMNTLVKSRGGRFVSIFQPIIFLHDNGPETAYDFEYRDEYELFRDMVFRDSVEYLRLDFSDLYDAHFDQVPYYDPKGDADLTDDAIFVDLVHVFDAGNRIIATEILEHIASK